MIKRGIPISVVFLLLLNEAFDTGAQYCFKRAAQQLGSPTVSTVREALAFSVDAFSQGYLWAGIAIIAGVFLSWAIVLTKVDLSVAIPLTSVSYVFVALASRFFLAENVSLLRWSGIGLILIGVGVVSATSEHPGPKA